MTTSDHCKMLNQLKTKLPKYTKFKKHNQPKDRPCGKTTKKCKRCGTNRGHIDKYGLDLCRRCFREIATRIGFKKFS